MSTQVLHGLAPAPPYQMGSAPSSPRVGVYDYQGKCACGLQHSQVHRGITVSIGEQTYTRWPHFQGDQGSRKQALRSSSRFNDSYGADALAWQQANHSLFTTETEHKELVNLWPQNHGRYPRDFQSTECQVRNRNSQYSEPLGHNGENTPTHDRAEISKRCMCINCVDNRRQQVEMAMGHSAYSEVSDQTSDWFLLHKGFEPENGRVSASRKVFPRGAVFKDEEQHDDERICEVESAISVSQPPGDPDSRRLMAVHVDRTRKSQLSPGAMTGRFAVPDEPLMPSAPRASDWPSKSGLAKASSEVTSPWNVAPLEPRMCQEVVPSQQGQTPLGKDLQSMNVVHSSFAVVEGGENLDRGGLLFEAQLTNSGACTPLSFYGDNFPGGVGRVEGDALSHQSAKSGLDYVDQGSNGIASFAGHGNTHLLSPDVIRLGSTAPAPAGLHPALVSGNTEQTVASPVFDHSPLSSTNMTKFSFATGKSTVLLPERILDKEPITAGISATGVLADSMASSVLDLCSDDILTWEMSDTDQDATYLDSQAVPKEVDNGSKVKLETKLGTLEASFIKVPVAEADRDGSSINEVHTPNGYIEAAVDKSSAANNHPEDIVNEELRAIQTRLSGGSNKISCQEKVSDVQMLGTGESKEPSLSEAEAEAIARGLQIIKNSDLEDMKELGSGTYGTVYHGKWRGSDVAIKRIKASCFTGPPSDRERLMADFWREACTLGQLHHPNVVAFYGIVPDGPGGTLATVTEYMVNGSLKQVLHKKDRTIDRRKRLFIAMDAAFGMEYLHSKNIVHFDLKCENLLVNMRDAHRPICKVGDFGLSKVKHHTLVSGGVRGTLPWMAPELLSGNSSMVSEKVDVFSFGIVMWELLTGEEPYANMHCGAIIGGIANNTLRPSIPSWCDPGWRSLMERCWSGNPAERPPFAEVARELRAIAGTMNLK
ncbi:hypothetical protein GOP47_0004366 [Adiantum capillus-veneris]|nr:hypothetical protein GOP47_0004366 [Adiantum capillus-veneris]